MILGESGSGKSTSLRNLDPAKTLLIQPIAKPLPFRSLGWEPFNFDTKTGTVYATDDAKSIVAAIQNAHLIGKPIIVVDDFQYVMANEFMRRSNEKGFEKFTEIGKNAWNIANASTQGPPHVRVYLLSHVDRDDSGRVKAKTIGKMLDEKICLEGMFTIVLRSLASEGKYLFTTQTNGMDTAKSPMGMFPTPVIENDLAATDRAICSYYEIAA